VRFWDSSAIVPLVVAEPASEVMRGLASDGSELIVWWTAPVECASALARRERSGTIALEDASQASITLEELAETWVEVPPRTAVRDDARRLVRIHDLRAADAFQLAAARVASEAAPETLPVVTLDERLAAAARREGFPVLPG
jgi:uncharacterized protein